MPGHNGGSQDFVRSGLNQNFHKPLRFPVQNCPVNFMPRLDKGLDGNAFFVRLGLQARTWG